MERILGKKVSQTGEPLHCAEPATWPQDMAFDGSDEELSAFYNHAAVCPYHKEMVEAANSEFQLNLIRFNSRLRASQETNNQARVITYGPAERSISVNGRLSEE